MLNDFPLWPERASTFAVSVDYLFLFILVVCAFFAALIFLLVVFLAIRYRRRTPDERATQINNSLPLELMWTGVPICLAGIMFFWGAALFMRRTIVPPNAQEIYVVGKQWMWKIQHSSGRREINEMHIPVGTPIRLTMATEDVIHSFFIPAFRVKSDVVPGSYRTMWFQATKTGQFHLFCAEYCGTRHAGMGGWIYVMEPGEYQRWLSGSSGMSVVASGEKLFQELGCVTCHKQDATGRGPSLYGVYGSKVTLQSGNTLVADDNYIRESILNPQAKIVAGHQPIMPTYQGLVSEEGLLQIIAYIKTLHAPNANPGNAPPPGQGATTQSQEVSTK
jgi:cytochrome c oxidase subunit II